ncbi:MAG: hypothetical protein ABSH27_14600 [Solirubrobacteraceae bacterium]|jgi:uncharacterized lipoprotein YddW (UPF0748 family)
MYAVVIDVTFKDDVAAAQAELGGIVPQVSAAPGFVAGYWIALSQTKGTSVVVFESEEAAQALAQMAQSGPATMAVTTDRIEVGEVMAHA